MKGAKCTPATGKVPMSNVRRQKRGAGNASHPQQTHAKQTRKCSATGWQICSATQRPHLQHMVLEGCHGAGGGRPGGVTTILSTQPPHETSPRRNYHATAVCAHGGNLLLNLREQPKQRSGRGQRAVKWTQRDTNAIRVRDLHTIRVSSRGKGSYSMMGGGGAYTAIRGLIGSVSASKWMGAQRTPPPGNITSTAPARLDGSAGLTAGANSSRCATSDVSICDRTGYDFVSTSLSYREHMKRRDRKPASHAWNRNGAG
jgi:hypothetical protein